MLKDERQVILEGLSRHISWFATNNNVEIPLKMLKLKNDMVDIVMTNVARNIPGYVTPR